MFKRTTAINKIIKLTARKKVIQGGTSAGKTIAILAILIDKAIKTSNLEISVVAESFPHLRRGATKDFLNIMKNTNRFNRNQWNATTSKYTFFNNSYIEFFSADSQDALRGARRDILYCNEANRITFEAYHQLAIRTNLTIYLDFNPTMEFWAHSEVLKDSDSEFIKLTYKDNEALSDSIVKELEMAKEKGKESKYWENWWRVYGLGEIGNLQGVVFSNWEQVDKIHEDAKYLGSGMDFGFTTSSTAIVDVYRLNDYLILDEICYSQGLLATDIEKKIKGGGKKRIVYADEAQPQQIAELQKLGCSVYRSKKTTINFGIDLMQRFNIKVTSRSLNLIKELRGYCWDTDKTGKTIGIPVKIADHAIDATRYCITSVFHNNVKADIR